MGGIYDKHGCYSGQCCGVFACLSQQWVEYMINVVVTVLWGVCWFITISGLNMLNRVLTLAAEGTC